MRYPRTKFVYVVAVAVGGGDGLGDAVALGVGEDEAPALGDVEGAAAGETHAETNAAATIAMTGRVSAVATFIRRARGTF